MALNVQVEEVLNSADQIAGIRAMHDILAPLQVLQRSSERVGRGMSDQWAQYVVVKQQLYAMELPEAEKVIIMKLVEAQWNGHYDKVYALACVCCPRLCFRPDFSAVVCGDPVEIDGEIVPAAQARIIVRNKMLKDAEDARDQLVKDLPMNIRAALEVEWAELIGTLLVDVPAAVRTALETGTQRQMHPALWVKLKLASKYPHMVTYVMEPVLSIMASAAPIESINSVMKYIMSSRRTRMRKDVFKKLVMIYVNCRAREKDLMTTGDYRLPGDTRPLKDVEATAPPVLRAGGAVRLEAMQEVEQEQQLAIASAMVAEEQYTSAQPVAQSAMQLVVGEGQVSRELVTEEQDRLPPPPALDLEADIQALQWTLDVDAESDGTASDSSSDSSSDEDEDALGLWPLVEEAEDDEDSDGTSDEDSVEDPLALARA